MSSQVKHLYEFGQFRLDPRTRTLVRENTPVALTPKAVEMLVVLVKNRDRVVSKDELMKMLWPDSFVEESNLSQNIFVLRKALGDSAQERRYILTFPGRGYQFTGTVHEIGEREEEALIVESHTLSQVEVRETIVRSTWLRGAVLAVVTVAVIVLIGVSGVRWFSHRALPPNSRALLFVADFTNSTGDAVFDDVLREIVHAELDRSPAVAVVEDERLAELLQTMGKSYGARLTPELTQQLCERGQGKLLAQGEIKPQGAGYVIELSVLDCASGRILSHQRSEATDKDEVMPTVSRLAAATRLQLSGNSGNPSAPPAALPTLSLPAYKAYLMGANLVHTQPRLSAARLRQATELDPNFAEAWNWLAIADRMVGETQRETQDLKRAFALRDQQSDSSKAFAEARYYLTVTGEIYQGIDALRSWENLEPSQFPPHNLLGLSYADLGLYQKATDEFRLAVAVFPSDEAGYASLANVLLEQGRYDEAETTLRRIPAGEPEEPRLHFLKYLLALMRSDRPALESEQAWMDQNADDLSVVSTQARIDLLEGRLDRARQRTQHAVSIALESGLKESAANSLLCLAEPRFYMENHSPPVRAAPKL